jgi:hypothetical protein
MILLLSKTLVNSSLVNWQPEKRKEKEEKVAQFGENDEAY